MKKLTLIFTLLSFTFFIFNCSEPSSKKSEFEDFIDEGREIYLEIKENDSKVEELGYFISEALEKQDIKGFLSRFDLDYFLNKITYKTGMSQKQKINSKAGFKQGITSLPKDISSQVKEGALYNFISYRYDSIQEAYFMLFRFFTEEDGLNYHDYKVSQIGGKFMFSDIYIFLTGENISQTMKRIVISSLSSNSLMEKLNPTIKKDLNKAVKATNYLKTGQHQEAYDSYNSMSNKMRNEKFVLIMKGQAASSISDELYQKTMEELMAYHPEDNTLSINYIDYYLLKEDYTKTLEEVNKLKEETGDDFLEYLIGNINYMKGDYATAKNNFKYITENYEDFSSAYFSYLACLTKNNEFNEAVEMLDELLKQDYEKFDLINYMEISEEGVENDFEEFIESSQYLRWKKRA